jgi:hypothetical protein
MHSSLFSSAVVAVLALVVHGKAVALPRAAADCSSLVGQQYSPGIEVLEAIEFPAYTLNISSDYSGNISNSFSLCRVQGTIMYAAGGDDTPDPDGANTLTWELYLPENSSYVGRSIAVGELSITLSLLFCGTHGWLTRLSRQRRIRWGYR